MHTSHEVGLSMAMKKTVAFLSIFAIALLLAGCGQKAVEKPAAQVQQATQDSTGLDTTTVQQEQQDLNTDELNDIDAGLSEIENI